MPAGKTQIKKRVDKTVMGEKAVGMAFPMPGIPFARVLTGEYLDIEVLIHQTDYQHTNHVHEVLCVVAELSGCALLAKSLELCHK